MPGQSYESLESLFFSNLGGGQFRAYRDDPVGFTHDILGIDLWERQVEGVDAIREHDRVVERSGHGIGKTLQVSCIALWAVYALSWLVLSTAPTFRQVESVLWREIAKRFRGSKKQLPGTLLSTQLKTPDAFALGLSTNEPERFQGYHDAEGILVIEDESPGVPPSIHDAIEGVLSGGGKWYKIGNPTTPSGPFFDAFRNPQWHGIHVSSWEHPNVVSGQVVIPGAVTREWCEAKQKDWGTESPLYQARVLGEFPDEGEDTLIRLSWVEAAFNGTNVGLGDSDGSRINADRGDRGGYPEGLGDDPVLSCDVARYGQDDTVIGLRTGYHYREIERYNGKDTVYTANRLASYYRAFNASIVVDDVGVGGGVTDNLEDQDIPVTRFEGGAGPDNYDNDDKIFADQNAQAWWAMREALREGRLVLDITDDPDNFKHQLTSRKYSYVRKGVIKLESKDHMKARGVKSPDRADALAMSFAPNPIPLVL